MTIIPTSRVICWSQMGTALTICLLTQKLSKSLSDYHWSHYVTWIPITHTSTISTPCVLMNPATGCDQCNAICFSNWLIIDNPFWRPRVRHNLSHIKLRARPDLSADNLSHDFIRTCQLMGPCHGPWSSAEEMMWHGEHNDNVRGETLCCIGENSLKSLFTFSRKLPWWAQLGQGSRVRVNEVRLRSPQFSSFGALPQICANLSAIHSNSNSLFYQQPSA